MLPDTAAAPRRRPAWSDLLAIAAIAGAVSMFEIALTRIFSFTIWHHFASMVISVAMLGFAASGSLLQLRPQWAARAAERAAACAALFAVAVIAATWILARIAFDPTQIGVDATALLRLGLHYAVLLVPFALAGLAIVLLLDGFAGSTAELYAGDLGGAGLGCLVAVVALDWVGAQGLVWGAAAAAATGGFLLRREHGSRRGAALAAWAALPAVLLLSLPFSMRLLPIAPGPGKALRDFLDTARFPEARLTHTQWNAISRVDVVEGSGTVRWTANPYDEQPLPPQTQIVIDGDAATPVVAWNGDLAALPFLDRMLPSAALQALRPRRVLVIGAGGGVDVLAALRQGAAHVDAVEINPAIAALARDQYGEWGGHLFDRPDVTLHVDEGRSFVRGSTESFDLIQLSLVDTWAASASGAYSLMEAYLYTVEAFADDLAHLTDGGVLSITRWLWSPPRETLKLCAVALEALRRGGAADPAAHIIVLSLGRLGNVLVKKTPFTAADLAALQQVATAHNLTFLYAPGVEGSNEFVELMRAADARAWIDRYVFDVSPATDDRPFFFQFGRWRDAGLFGAGWRESMLSLSGRLVLLATSAQALLFSAVLLILPRLARRRDLGRGAAAAIVYFAAIGLSFMLLEINLMQRFTLFLGRPVYAIACVLAVLLLSAGAGSAIWGVLLRGSRWRRMPLVAIAVLVVGYGFLLPSLFAAALGQALAIRLAIAVVLLVPLGILLGMPFPAAVESLRVGEESTLLGWAWAANGCASVLGPLLAVMIAMEVGFTVVGWLAAGGYLVAAAMFERWRVR